MFYFNRRIKFEVRHIFNTRLIWHFSKCMLLWRCQGSIFLFERRKKLLFILQRAVDRGELRSDVSLEIVIDMLFGFCWYRLLTDQIDDDVFYNHVTKERNDFVNWISDVFKERELAKKLSGVMDKKDFQLILLKHVVSKKTKRIKSRLLRL